MTASLDLGNNYDFEEDSNGNLVIKDSSGNAVLRHNDGGKWDVPGEFNSISTGNYNSDQRILLFSVEFQSTPKSTTGTPGSFDIPDSSEFSALNDFSEALNQSTTLEAKLIVQTGGTMETDADFRGTISTDNDFFATPTVTLSNTFSTGSSGFVEVTDGGVSNLTTQWRGDGTNTISITKATMQFYVTL